MIGAEIFFNLCVAVELVYIVFKVGDIDTRLSDVEARLSGLHHNLSRFGVTNNL
jgi:hypothetical protein